MFFEVVESQWRLLEVLKMKRISGSDGDEVVRGPHVGPSVPSIHSFSLFCFGKTVEEAMQDGEASVFGKNK